jgi:uncharacterized membrane protein YcaP (DUF421 family)
LTPTATGNVLAVAGASEARKSPAASFCRVEWAILESNGQIGFIEKTSS